MEKQTTKPNQNNPPSKTTHSSAKPWIEMDSIVGIQKYKQIKEEWGNKGNKKNIWKEFS